MAFALVVAALLLAWSAAVNLLQPLRRRYVAINAAAAAALLLAGRWHGLTWVDLGLDPQAVSAGLGWGLLAAAVVAAVLGGFYATRGRHPVLEDQRIAGLEASGAVRWAIVRVPFGTVLLEEVAFRGVLLAAWAQEAGVAAAVLASSAVFGLWHVVPTVQTVLANRPQIGRGRLAGSVAAGVVLTAVAGIALCWLRLVSGSLLAPALAHLAANSLAVLAAYRALRR